MKIHAAVIGFFLGIGLLACAPLPPEPSDSHLNQRIQSKLASSEIPRPIMDFPLPPVPELRAEEEVYTVVVHDVPLRELLFAIARDAQVNIDIAENIGGTLTLNAIDQTLPQLLDRISRLSDIRYSRNNDLILIERDAPYLVHYPVGYVNMSRQSTSLITISTEIATTGQGVSGNSSTTGNDSQTIIETESNNRFWATLAENVQAILRGGDSISSVYGEDSGAASGGQESNSEGPTVAQEGQGSDAATIESTRDESSAATDQTRSTDIVDLGTSIVASPESGLLSVRANSRQHARIKEYIDLVLKGAKRQVLIEATIVEVQLNDDYQAGVDWQYLVRAGAEGVSYSQFLTGGALGNAPVSILNITDSSNSHDLSATVRLLNQFGDAKVLSSPKLMVLNNQTALLKVVDNRVYFTIDVKIDIPSNSGTIIRTFETEIHSVPVGFVMSVTPQISNENEVILNVRPTISRILRFVNDPNPVLAEQNVVNPIPEISVREMESILRIKDGDIAIIGGLMQDNQNNSTAGLPVLSRVPLIGDLFSFRDNVYQKSELVIFIRPVVSDEQGRSTRIAKYNELLPKQQRRKFSLSDIVQ